MEDQIAFAEHGVQWTSGFGEKRDTFQVNQNDSWSLLLS